MPPRTSLKLALLRPACAEGKSHASTRPAAEDGGQSWKREKAADSLAANLYELVFTPAGLGFVLGNDGVLLRVRACYGSLSLVAVAVLCACSPEPRQAALADNVNACPKRWALLSPYCTMPTHRLDGPPTLPSPYPPLPACPPAEDLAGMSGVKSRAESLSHAALLRLLRC